MSSQQASRELLLVMVPVNWPSTERKRATSRRVINPGTALSGNGFDSVCPLFAGKRNEIIEDSKTSAILEGVWGQQLLRVFYGWLVRTCHGLFRS
mmetsp:Transcript_20963/g.43973  ORF Transcript_20963/g.43973 Transcript_20963/m.43973 type:complete len:95 (+) Transcript_20963:112-396(+)